MREPIARAALALLASALIIGPPAAQAANQMFTAEWSVKAQGNECVKSAPGQPQCVQPPASRTGPSEFYSAWGIPQGVQCNEKWPRCPFNSTPTDGAGNFMPLGGYWTGTYCAPWNDPKWGSKTMRPAKGGTATNSKGRPIPPLYRNDAFFTTTTPSAQPNWTYCNATSTSLGGFPGKTGGKGGGPGKVMLGNPITGTWTAMASTTGGFTFKAAPVNANIGLRTGQGTRYLTTWGAYRTASARSGQRGDFQNIYPYIYSYTYATLRNAAGAFGPGQGPGSFSLPYKVGANTVAKVVVKQGAAKFGGTMRMLGAFTTKVCYFRQGGCSITSPNWRYEAIGAAAYTSGGVVTQGYRATWCLDTSPGPFGQCGTVENPTFTLLVSGSRFPWTTGSVTVTAKRRGPHKTVHYAHGYDNRTPTSHKGTIQLVSPMLTRWLRPCCRFETGGIGILRIKFLPEPQTWAMLVAGALLLGVGYRVRGR